MADTGRFSPVEGALTLPKQHFTGNPLDRLSDIRNRFEASASSEGEVSLVVVAGREVVVRPAPSGHMPGVLQELQALLLRTDDPELALAGEEMFLNWRPSGCRPRCNNVHGSGKQALACITWRCIAAHSGCMHF